MSISLNGDGIISGVSTLTNPSEITVGTGASVFSPATNTLALGTNGSERVRVDSSGDLILKTSGTMSDGKFVFREGSDDAFSIRTTGANGAIEIYDEWDDATRLHIDTSGDFGIGTNNPSTKLEIVGPHSSGNITTVLKISGNAWSSGGGSALEFGQDPATYPTWVTGRIASTYSGGSWGGGLKFFYNNGTTAETLTEGMELTRDGNLAFPSGKGIDFSATSNSSGTMTSELLSDYEEGSWTPAISFSSSDGDLGYSIRYGSYRKVGTLVLCHGYIWFSETTASGNLSISGLPFTVSNDGTYGTSSINPIYATGGSFTTLPFLAAQPNSTNCAVYTSVNTAATNSQTNNNTVFSFSLAYIST